MYTYKKTILNILKGDLIQEEQIYRLMHLSNEIKTSQALQDETWSRIKIPSIKLCSKNINKNFKPIKTKQDNGWVNSRYTSILPTEERIYRKNTKIKAFTELIHIDIEYTQEQILHKLEQAGYKQPSSMFISITRDTKWAKKMFIETDNGNWKMQ